MLTHIYTLSCPDTGAIRYVGKANDLQARLRGHLSCAGRERTRKARWICSLARQGKRPTIESIDLVPDSEWQFWEQHWVQVIGGCWGFDLTNGDAGGLGMGRCTPEMAKKIAMKLSGVPNLALSKPVFQYSASGEYLAEFKSVADGATSAGGVSRKHRPRHQEAHPGIRLPVVLPTRDQHRARCSASAFGRVDRQDGCRA